MYFVLLLAAFCIIYIVYGRFRRSLTVGNFTDKYVFITGCDTGFGHELAIHLDSLGFHVFAGCLTENGTKSLPNVCSSRLRTVLLDISNGESVAAALEFVKQKLPAEKGLWALVNNAGILGSMSPVELCIKDDYIKILNVNLLGPVEMTRQFLPLVRKCKGRIVTITSAFARFPGFGVAYCASKFGLEAYSDILRRDLYSQGIKVSILEPGGFPTAISTPEKMAEEMNKALERASPDLRKVYEPYYAKWKAASGKPAMVAPSLKPVIDAYTHAVTAKYPRNRYVVGFDAQFIFIPLSYLPDWLCDWLLRMVVKSI